jgi:enoyl-[acyl-carrier protein] reductase II
MFLMGAAGVQLGTRFAIAEESCAHPAFKEAFIKAKARDAISTPKFDSRLPVVAVRALRNEGTDDFGRLQLELIRALDEGRMSRSEVQIKVEEFWMGRLREAVLEGNVTRGSLMSGQSVGLVNSVMSVADIIGDLRSEAEAELQKVRGSFLDT